MPLFFLESLIIQSTEKHNHLKKSCFFQYFKYLQQHILYKHSKSKPWKCNMCEYSHASKTGLNSHIRRNHEADNRRHICHICSFRFKVECNLKQHILQVHEKVRVKCETCGKQFCTKTRLREHVKVTHLGLLLDCKECSEQFDSRSRLFDHVKNCLI